jgi:acetoin utilization deacetylase AcuC-like enzyme
MHELVYFYPTAHEAHNEPGHPERPERVEAIRRALKEAGLWHLYPQLHPIDIGEELLASVHSPAYLASLERACRRANYLDADTYTRAPPDLALRGRGAAVVALCLARLPGVALR